MGIYFAKYFGGGWLLEIKIKNDDLGVKKETGKGKKSRCAKRGERTKKFIFFG